MVLLKIKKFVFKKCFSIFKKYFYFQKTLFENKKYFGYVFFEMLVRMNFEFSKTFINFRDKSKYVNQF